MNSHPIDSKNGFLNTFRSMRSVDRIWFLMETFLGFFFFLSIPNPPLNRRFIGLRSATLRLPYPPWAILFGCAAEISPRVLQRLTTRVVVLVRMGNERSICMSLEVGGEDYGVSLLRRSHSILRPPLTMGMGSIPPFIKIGWAKKDIEFQSGQ